MIPPSLGRHHQFPLLIALPPPCVILTVDLLPVLAHTQTTCRDVIIGTTSHTRVDLVGNYMIDPRNAMLVPHDFVAFSILSEISADRESIVHSISLSDAECIY